MKRQTFLGSLVKRTSAAILVGFAFLLFCEPLNLNQTQYTFTNITESGGTEGITPNGVLSL